MVINEKTKERALRLRKSGMDFGDIARSCGVSYATARGWCEPEWLAARKEQTNALHRLARATTPKPEREMTEFQAKVSAGVQRRRAAGLWGTAPKDEDGKFDRNAHARGVMRKRRRKRTEGDDDKTPRRNAGDDRHARS